jgi:hypothetical protein
MRLINIMGRMLLIATRSTSMGDQRNCSSHEAEERRRRRAQGVDLSNHGDESPAAKRREA